MYFAEWDNLSGVLRGDQIQCLAIRQSQHAMPMVPVFAAGKAADTFCLFSGRACGLLYLAVTFFTATFTTKPGHAGFLLQPGHEQERLRDRDQAKHVLLATAPSPPGISQFTLAVAIAMHRTCFSFALVQQGIPTFLPLSCSGA